MALARLKRFAVMLIVAVAACLTTACNDEGTQFRNITIGGETFRVELAITNEQVRHGMMGRTSVGANEGMLFLFPDNDVREFWMKDCLIPLDILFLDGRGRIISMMTMDVPKPGEPLPSYSSRWEAHFAVELKAGTIDRLKLHEGDRVEMGIEELKRLAR